MSNTIGSVASTQINNQAFMNLLVAQLQYQNPLDPTSNEQMMSQLVQFSSLEQLQNLNASFEDVFSEVQLAQAASLLGTEVTFSDEDGELWTGVVNLVGPGESGVNLLIEGQVEVPLERVTAIGLPVVTGESGTPE